MFFLSQKKIHQNMQQGMSQINTIKAEWQNLTQTSNLAHLLLAPEPHQQPPSAGSGSPPSSSAPSLNLPSQNLPSMRCICCSNGSQLQAGCCLFSCLCLGPFVSRWAAVWDWSRVRSSLFEQAKPTGTDSE